MSLGAPTQAGSCPPGLVQVLAPSPEPQQAGTLSGHKGHALPDSGPQVLGAPYPQSGDLFCSLSAARDMTAPGWGSRSRDVSLAQDSPSRGHPSWASHAPEAVGSTSACCSIYTADFLSSSLLVAPPWEIRPHYASSHQHLTCCHWMELCCENSTSCP